MIAALVLAGFLHQPPQVLSQPRRVYHDRGEGPGIMIMVDLSISTELVRVSSPTFDTWWAMYLCKLVRPRFGDPLPPDFWRCYIPVPAQAPTNAEYLYGVEACDLSQCGEQIFEARLFCDAAGGGTGCNCHIFARTDRTVPCEYP